ncbi:MAG: MOSC domain-containing protein [Ilumatobacteraceae bacterium]
MKLDQIWVYPVKSMEGDTVDSGDMDAFGIVGDRMWAVRDLENGGIRGAKKLGALMQLSARYTGRLDEQGRRIVEITLPDGQVVTSGDPAVDEMVSAFVGTPVRLEHLQPADDLDHYRRGAPGSEDMLTELRAVFGRDESEPLPDFSVFPTEVIEFESPPGTYYDCWPLMVMTTSALRAVRDAVPSSVVDVRRFRPSLVIDVPEVVGHPEFGWANKRATLGSCEIEFLSPCPRCVMVTRRVNSDVPDDRDILRHIVRDLDQNLGIYGRITKPGRVNVGDELIIRD